jgi:hypothetical protein
MRMQAQLCRSINPCYMCLWRVYQGVVLDMVYKPCCSKRSTSGLILLHEARTKARSTSGLTILQDESVRDVLCVCMPIPHAELAI